MIRFELTQVAPVVVNGRGVFGVILVADERELERVDLADDVFLFELLGLALLCVAGTIVVVFVVAVAVVDDDDDDDEDGDGNRSGGGGGEGGDDADDIVKSLFDISLIDRGREKMPKINEIKINCQTLSVLTSRHWFLCNAHTKRFVYFFVVIERIVRIRCPT